MAKSAETFRVGDFVWARLKGFPPWPGRIIEPYPGMKVCKNKRLVYFYGEENYAWIGLGRDSLWPYKEFKDVYGQPKRPRKC